MREIITLTNYGLLLDVIGSVLMFFYGMPEKGLFRDGSIAWMGDKPEEDKDEAKEIHSKAQLGLILFIMGFVFQLIGNITSTFSAR